MSNSQKKIAMLAGNGDGVNSRQNYNAFINAIKSMSIIERLYWLVILFCLIGGLL